MACKNPNFNFGKFDIQYSNIIDEAIKIPITAVNNESLPLKPEAFLF